MKWLKINGHHVYTVEHVFMFLFRFRIGTGKWRYGVNALRINNLCEEARDRVIDSLWTNIENDDKEEIIEES